MLKNSTYPTETKRPLLSTALVLLAMWLALTGCTLMRATAPPDLTPATSAQPARTETPTPTATAAPTATPPYADEVFTMGTICFEYALENLDTVVVLRDAEAHSALYDAVDASGRCRQPVQRVPFDFASGTRMLVGTWHDGIGCTARHEITRFDHTPARLVVEARLVIGGTCNYELIRPLWLGVEAAQTVELSLVGTTR